MRESIKAVCTLLFMIAACVAGVMWFEDRPNQTTWWLRIGSTALALLSVGVLLKLHFRADAAPDYLRQVAGNYFNRGGFCFAFTTSLRDGICYLEAYFQNQQDQPCVGRIALRPARGFFLGRAKIDTITFEVHSEPAGFGVSRIPVPLTKEVQGKRQSFEVGASVHYPQGKGRKLRFRDGIFLRANSQFGNSFATALTVAGALGGSIVLTKPATTTIVLPTGVAEELPANAKPEIFTLWKLGDPPLGAQGLTGAFRGAFRGHHT
jgi:hypothetical protein